ncbi:ribose ABC transporter permease [Paenibacillus ferrarius]|uniref:Ribose ABC transporter permease n=1 Tax=Paenibacillus ferrarius TaxID=1469647 RepID=A0A1V4HPT3_9BACL|nr:ribose ABC transporter permease [Paenibacillus ferrarius]
MNAFIALVVLMIVLSFIAPSFLTSKNLLTVLLQSSLNSIVAVGMTFIIISGGIDLSVGAIVALSAAVMGELVVNQGVNPYIGLLIPLVIGVAVGWIHGVVITKFNINPFIVTLGAMTIWRGAALVFVQGRTIYGLPDAITWLGQGYVGPIPVAVLLTAVVYLVAWFLLTRTKIGMYTYSIGGNEKASRLSGIHTDRAKIFIYAFGGLLCGLTGIIVAGRINGTSALVGNGYELDAIAAVVIGGTSLAGGRGVIWGTLIGAIIMGVIRNGLNLLNVSPYYQLIIIGIVIVAAVGLDSLKQKKD